jgi:hypothetical protein
MTAHELALLTSTSTQFGFVRHLLSIRLSAVVQLTGTPDQIAAVLGQYYTGWADGLTDEQYDAISCWQSSEHEIINQLTRAEEDDPDLADRLVAEHGRDYVTDLLRKRHLLAEACEIRGVPGEFTVYRGVDTPGYRKLLQRLPGHPDSLRRGDLVVDPGFFATSVHEDYAKARMGKPFSGALLLELGVPAGMRAAWLPGLHILDQGELLFGPGTACRVTRITPIGYEVQARDTRAEADIELQ